MKQEKESVTLKELCELSGQRYSTVKFYSEEGLLPYSQDGARLRRKYEPKSSLKQLEKIGKLKEQRKTLDEIKEILK